MTNTPTIPNTVPIVGLTEYADVPEREFSATMAGETIPTTIAIPDDTVALHVSGLLFKWNAQTERWEDTRNNTFVLPRPSTIVDRNVTVAASTASDVTYAVLTERWPSVNSIDDNELWFFEVEKLYTGTGYSRGSHSAWVLTGEHVKRLQAASPKSGTDPAEYGGPEVGDKGLLFTAVGRGVNATTGLVGNAVSRWVMFAQGASRRILLASSSAFTNGQVRIYRMRAH